MPKIHHALFLLRKQGVQPPRPELRTVRTQEGYLAERRLRLSGAGARRSRDPQGSGVGSSAKLGRRERQRATRLTSRQLAHVERRLRSAARPLNAKLCRWGCP